LGSNLVNRGFSMKVRYPIVLVVILITTLFSTSALAGQNTIIKRYANNVYSAKFKNGEATVGGMLAIKLSGLIKRDSEFARIIQHMVENNLDRLYYRGVSYEMNSISTQPAKIDTCEL
jgi:hypothetical protein